MLDEGFVAEAKAKTMQQERQGVHAVLQFAVSFHCFVEEWKIVKNSSRSQKKSGFSWIRKGKKRSIVRRGGLRPTSIDERGVEGKEEWTDRMKY